ncbi:MAG TPA: undecaprenyl/decaprenyl-phosphate alpha-N-acetylglucosaminyl 1-phosphate transferase [Clostridia bacterium]|nr:undecaprenyl/decaprenyl-phosphate alpha-N-acetylglucosaminyl 1-phosphate transferase [Clostridia bacterium]
MLGVLAAFLLTWLVTPWIKKLAVRWGALDKPNGRKVHRRVMPRMGGVAMYLSFAAVVLATQPLNNLVLGLLVGATWIIILGILDDIKGLSAKVKLVGQIAGAAILVAFGYRVEFITNPFSDGLLMLGKLAVPLTILWVIGVTNAINLIDGLDGLAAGTSGIAALTMAAVVVSEYTLNGSLGDISWLVISLALILTGSIAGFLRYNFHPAQIFMGDSGSMFLGFTLSALAIAGLTKGATVISVFIPIVILGIPICDTLFAIVRRFLNQQPIFQPDKHHLHHCLLEKGLSHKQTVVTIYGINVLLGISAVLLTRLNNDQAIMLLIGLAFLVLVGANRLGVTGAGTVTGQVEERRTSLPR